MSDELLSLKKVLYLIILFDSIFVIVLDGSIPIILYPLSTKLLINTPSLHPISNIFFFIRMF